MTIRRTVAEVRQMSKSYWSGSDVTAHLSKMGMTTIAAHNGARFIG